MGRDDPLIPPVNGRIMASLIPNAELKMIEDGHMFMVTQPARTADLIETFLADERRAVAPSIRLPCAFGYLRNLVWTSGDGHRKS